MRRRPRFFLIMQNWDVVEICGFFLYWVFSTIDTCALFLRNNWSRIAVIFSEFRLHALVGPWEKQKRLSVSVRTSD